MVCSVTLCVYVPMFSYFKIMWCYGAHIKVVTFLAIRKVQPSLCPYTKLSIAEQNYMQISYTSTYLNWTMNVEGTR